MAPGALDTEVRSRVLDALGIEAQLVFPTFAAGPLLPGARTPTSSTAGPRRSTGPWSRSARPTPGSSRSGYLPLNDPDAGAGDPRAALDAGVAAVWVPSDAPGDFSPTHVDLDPVWARLAEARRALRAARGRRQAAPQGLPRQRAAAAQGLARRRARTCAPKDFPVLHHSPERFLACMALDGVFERHPELRGARHRARGHAGCPACCATSTTPFAPSPSSSRRCRSCSLLPSEYLRRQVRFTPFPFEDTAWLIEQCGPELFMFSTDYPHPEGGKRPFEAFGEAVAGFDESTQERFFWRNGAELLGLA